MIRIIDHKKVELTDDEWRLYQKICDSYKKQGGAVLFSGLFETDDNGIILFIRPPSTQWITMEIVIYLMSVMQQQHLRVMYKRVDEAITEMRDATQKAIENLETRRET